MSRINRQLFTLLNLIIVLQLQFMGFTQELINNMFCGSIAGVGNCVSGFALDTVKTRMQLQKIGIIQCFSSIIKNEGFMALFSGIYYPLVTIPLVNAVSFGSYQLYKKIDGSPELSFWAGMEAGAFSGLIGSFIVNPVELVKIRMQAGNNNFSTSAECLKSILKTEGVRGIYKGMFSTIARQIPSMGGQFAAYEITKQFFLKRSQKKQLTIFQSIITGGIAGLGAWALAYPQDVIKTNLQNNSRSFSAHRWIPDGGFFQCGKQIVLKDGIRGLFAGIQPLILRAFIANACMIVFYQQAQSFLRLIYKSQQQQQ